MVFADEIRKTILQLAEQRKSETFSAAEVARLVDPENWQNLMDQVRFVATVLIQEGKITAIQADNLKDSLTLKKVK